MSDLLITNATLVPMTGTPRVIEGGYLLALEGRIVSLGAGPPPAVAPAVPRIDAGGKVLLPGLVNAHTHLYQTLLRGLWENLPLLPWLRRVYGTGRCLEPGDVYAGSLLGCVEAIQSGVTTVCEHYFLNRSPEHARAAGRAILRSGLRGALARTLMTAGELVPEEVREPLAAGLAATEDLLRTFEAEHRSGRLAIMTGPNTPPLTVPPELLGEIRRFADERGLGVSAHVAESCSVLEHVQKAYGQPGVVHLLDAGGLLGPRTVFAHCVHLVDGEIERLSEHGVAVSHNPVSNMLLGDGIAPVREMLARGVTVALGTDGAASNHSQDMFETMKAASLLQRVRHLDPSVIDPYTVLRMATAGGARALGLGDVCGTLEAGKAADVILVDVTHPHNGPVHDLFSTLVHATKATDVDTTVVGGRVLMAGRKLRELDPGVVLEEARAAAGSLKSRLAQLGLVGEGGRE